MLVVNENTYITIEEADELISSRIDKYNGLRLFWEILDDKEKEQYLIRSIEQLETLVYPGRRSQVFQRLSFPRAPMVEVPADIKLAQAYNALGCLNADMIAAGEEAKKVYARFGVYIGAMAAETAAIPVEKQSVDKVSIASKKAAQIANKYVRGGFRMR